MTVAKIREDARTLLRGRFALAIAVSLILAATGALTVILSDGILILSGMLDYESGTFVITDLARNTAVMIAFFALIGVAQITLAYPLAVGVCRWFFAFADGKYPSVDIIFFPFTRKDYGRTVVFSLRLFLKELMWGALCALPGLLISSLAYVFGFGSMLMAPNLMENDFYGLYCTGISTFMLGIAASKFICARYFLANYIFASSETVTGKEAVKLSVRMMKGRKTSLIGLIFTFTGWLLLTVPTFGLSLIYTVPYFNTSLGIYAKQSIDLYLEKTAANKTESVGG